MLRGQLAAVDVVDDDAREPRVSDVEQDGGQVVALQRVDLVVVDRQRDHEQAGDAVAVGEVAHRVRALLGRLHVEQQQVVPTLTVAREPRDHAAQALDRRMGREERHDDPDRGGPARATASAPWR